MKIRFAVLLALGFMLSLPALAQRPEERGQQRGQERHDNVHGNHRRIPEGAPPKRDNHTGQNQRGAKAAGSTAFLT